MSAFSARTSLDPELVSAAARGDRAALERVAEACLPLVYTVVGRAAESDLDVDDIVQETMIRVTTQLADVRRPQRARAWVVSVALRQVAEARRAAGVRRVRTAGGGGVTADELAVLAGPARIAEPDFVNLWMLRDSVDLERRHVARAARWLDPGLRAVLAAWTLEVGGELTRGQVADSLGLSASHAAVRVRRMKKQLDCARRIERALAAQPHCVELAAVARDWDGVRVPLWRKRLDRHVRECEQCSATCRRLVPLDRLLAGLPLAIVPGMAAPRVAAPVDAKVRPRVRPNHRLAIRFTVAGTSVAALVAGVVVVSVAATPHASSTADNLAVRSKVSSSAAASASSAKPAPTHASKSASASPTRKAPTSAASAPATASRSTTSVEGTLPEGAFSKTVPALPTAVTMTEEGAILQNSRVQGRDDGQSMLFNGQSVWVFDDTTMQNPWGFISNSGAATNDLDASDGIDLQSADVFTTAAGGTPETLIPLTGPEQAFQNAHASASGCQGSSDPYCGAIYGFWPGPVIADPARDRLLVLFGALCRGGQSGTPCTGPLGMALGTGIAALNMGSDTVTRLTTSGMSPVTSIEGPDPTLLFPASEGFSDAAIVVGQYAYVYGNCTFAGCEIGRVPLSQITDRADWLFYTSAGTWSADMTAATRVIAPGGAGQTVFYDPALSAYVNVFMPYGSNDVDYQIGGSPFGPWSASATVGQTPGGASVDYALFAHPEYAQDNGLIEYLSYFDPNSGAQQLLKLQFSTGAGD